MIPDTTISARLYHMDLSKVIKERRAELRISQDDLADIAGVGLATVKDIERGQGNPAISTIEKLFVVLGLELSANIKQTIVKL